MKRIAVVSNCLGDGGTQRVSAILANYFAQKGYEVMFIAAYADLREYFIEPCIKYQYVDVQRKTGVRRFIRRSLSIKKMVKDFKPDIVISFITTELIPVTLSGTPIISSLRNDPALLDHAAEYVHKRTFARNSIRRFVFNHSKNIVFQTPLARDYYPQNIRDKGVVIGNPIIDGLPDWKEDGHEKVFMAACRIAKQKNIPMLIDAFLKFHEKHSEYILELYGHGSPEDYKKELEEYCKEKNIDSFVKFMGHSTRVHERMSQVEAFFLTSDYEGISNSMLEAMAIGVPCVCTDVPSGSVREYMKNGEAGVIIPVGGIDQLEKAMYRIAENPSFRAELSCKERYVRDALNSEDICRQWEALI